MSRRLPREVELSIYLHRKRSFISFARNSHNVRRGPAQASSKAILEDDPADHRGLPPGISSKGPQDLSYDITAQAGMTMRIGIVGWGEIAQEHAFHLKSAGAKLAGIVSRRRNLDLEVPVFGSLQDMLPSVDAFTIAVPNHLHASLCLQGIKARKPVLVEKPLCINKEDLNQLASIMPKMKVPVHLGYRLRWNPSIQSLKRRLQGIRQVRCIYRIGIEHLAHRKVGRHETLF